MKNLYLYIIAVVFSTSFFAQVGVGTITPYTNASMDVFSEEKGVLVPRVALTDAQDIVTIANPAKGMYVFNTIDSGVFPNNVEKNSFYYWDGVKWNLLVDGPKFRKVLDDLNIPQLAGYWYKALAQTIYNPTGIAIAEYDTAMPLDYYSKFTEYMGYNTADPTQTSFLIKKTGLYGIEGFSCNLMSITNPSVNDAFFMDTVIQKSSDNGVTWEDTAIISTTPYMRSMTNGYTIPNYVTGAIQLVENDLIRIGVRLNFLSSSTTASYASITYIQYARSSALGVQYSVGFKATYYPQ